MHKRFEHQSGLFAGDRMIDNQINPQEFSDVDMVLFKKSLSVIEEVQNKLKLEFKGTISI
jgi:signal-transduction protein with cAMP-binding, CBS, and nucleotidyltransferase domain